jgi:hypothetical protein
MLRWRRSNTTPSETLLGTWILDPGSLSGVWIDRSTMRLPTDSSPDRGTRGLISRAQVRMEVLEGDVGPADALPFRDAFFDKVWAMNSVCCPRHPPGHSSTLDAFHSKSDCMAFCYGRTPARRPFLNVLGAGSLAEPLDVARRASARAQARRRRRILPAGAVSACRPVLVEFWQPVIHRSVDHSGSPL